MFEAARIRNDIGLLRKAVKQGDPRACRDLGRYYCINADKKRDVDIGIFLLHRAAAAGDGEAFFYLGWVHHRGVIVERNDRLRFWYYLQGARLGHDGCLNNVGVCYREGKGTKMDLKAAEMCWTEASHHGDVIAMMNIYWDFMKDGSHWVKVAADKGYKPAVNVMMVRARRDPIKWGGWQHKWRCCVETRQAVVL